MSSSKEPQALTDFIPRYHEHLVNLEKEDSLIKDLMSFAESREARHLVKVGKLQQTLREMRMELNDSAAALNDSQQRQKGLEAMLGCVSAPNPYIMVLIDGDSLLFKTNLVKKGLDGGRMAVELLHNATMDKFGYIGDTAPEILVKAVADVSGLGHPTKRDGAAIDDTTVRQFVTGFNQVKANFDFVDLGPSKEGADMKILESTRFHLRDFNCKRVVLGFSHDQSYISFLIDPAHDDGTKKRLAVIEGAPSVPEVLATGIDRAKFSKIFRHEKNNAKPVQAQPLLALPSSLVGQSGGISYAAVAQAGMSAPAGIALPKPTKEVAPMAQQSKPAEPVWNPGPRGLDPHIEVDRQILERLKHREDGKKLCNNHFLRGSCLKKGQCSFVHDYKPTAEEKECLEYSSRFNPCIQGQNCQDKDCIYGHHCPSVRNGHCYHKTCRFQVSDHPPGTKFHGARLIKQSSSLVAAKP